MFNSVKFRNLRKAAQRAIDNGDTILARRLIDKMEDINKFAHPNKVAAISKIVQLKEQILR